jgi:hypothetical protein
MVFTTAAEREEFFRRCGEVHDFVEFGDAMEHVRSSNLGIWGSEDGLRQDAARIVAFELRRLEGPEVELHDVDPIKRTEAFSSAFRQARAPNKEAITKGMRELGVAKGNDALAKCQVFGDSAPGREYVGRGLAKAVLKEMSS